MKRRVVYERTMSRVRTKTRTRTPSIEMDKPVTNHGEPVAPLPAAAIRAAMPTACRDRTGTNPQARHRNPKSSSMRTSILGLRRRDKTYSSKKVICRARSRGLAVTRAQALRHPLPKVNQRHIPPQVGGRSIGRSPNRMCHESLSCFADLSSSCTVSGLLDIGDLIRNI